MDYQTITLQKNLSTPLYRQLAMQIQQALLREELQPGEHLPPIRKLAHLLTVSPITISQAYEEWVLLGIASSHVGRGTFLLSRVPSPQTHPISQPLEKVLFMNKSTHG